MKSIIRPCANMTYCSVWIRRGQDLSQDLRMSQVPENARGHAML